MNLRNDWLLRAQKSLCAVGTLLLVMFGVVSVAAAQAPQAAIVRFAAASPALPNGQLVAELYRPSVTTRMPAVVLMHGCGGWHGAVRQSLASHARALVNEGFVVLNVDSFGPRGVRNGEMCADNERLREALRYRTHDAFAALEFLRAQPFVEPNHIFLIGQSNGGSVALLAAQDGAARRFGRGRNGFAGVVALYPWCGVFSPGSIALEAPTLILAGGQDNWTPADECRTLQSRTQALTVEVFQNAAHSFDVLVPRHHFLGYLIGYNHEATARSRLMIRDFFRQIDANRRVDIAAMELSRR